MIVKIQNRRGGYTDFDPSKLLPGEFAVVQVDDPNTPDGKAIYIAITAGNVVRLATANEIAAYNEQSKEVLIQVQQYSQQVQNALTTTRTKASEAAQSAQAAQSAEASVTEMLENAQDTIDRYAETATQTAVEQINQTYHDREDELNTKIDEMLAVKSNAEAIATEAKNKANELENEISEVAGKADRNTTKLNSLQFDVESMIHGWYIDVQKRLIFTDVDGNPIGDPIEGIGGSGGGGGGGSATNAEMSATNTTGWISNSISVGETVNVKVLWTSIENDLPTGNGVATIRVNGLIKATYEVPQGEVTFNLTNYLNSGTNNVKITVSDIYDQQRTLGFNISVLDLRMTSNFSTAVPFESTISFSYTPYGDVEKTVYIEVDDVVIHTQSTSASGRQLTYTIPAQSHGAHKLRAYFEALVNNQTVRSNVLYYEFISLETLNNRPIIISSFNTTQVNQYESVIIPWRVYTPTSDTTEVKLYVNNVLVSTQTADRTEQSYTYRANNAGAVAFKIEAGTESKTINFTVIESEITIEAETEDLALYLTAQGRSNNEETRDVWAYNDIAATFTNMSWIRDGWQTDSDGITVLRIEDDARVTIPYQIFGTDFKVGGKTIEIEFATRNVTNYRATILSCLADNIGLKITPQTVEFAGAQTKIDTLYKDNEHVRLSIVVEKQNENRLILIYINGIMSRAIQYASGERFSQLSPVGITIGSDECGIDIYNIRVYDNDLTRKQVLINWIADTQIGSLMVDRFDHNNVYDANDAITINNLPKDLPYFILEAEELPQYKGDKKTISGSYTDPVYRAFSFTFTGCQINVQGTSSAPYYRKNYDMQFKQGFITNTGTIENYALRQGSIPFNRFVLKADVASSESTNNTGLTMFYNDTCPYKTPEMLVNDKVRWGIEGVPIVVFWYDTVNQKTEFLGKYNFNLPKRCPTPLGFTGNMESWEWERNNSANVKFQDTDFTTMTADGTKPEWYNDFEARFPSDEWRDYAKLYELIAWVKSTWRDENTGDTLPSPVTYRVNTTATVNRYIGDSSYTIVEETQGGQTTGYYNITFTKDTAAYRLTKFRAEFDDYFERQSAIFYYLFTEVFTMIDSRAKNMFIGFNGSDVNIEGRAMDRKATIQPYDMDTAVGTNNSGILMFGYSLEDTDTVSSVISGQGGGSDAPVFNAQDSVLWVNLRDAFPNEISAMYRELRAGGTWSYKVVETMYENHQSKWPEAIFNEDAYIKYLVPLIEPVTYDEDTERYIKTDEYLTMLQGSKTEQRKWWLSNRFKYMDSKYTTGDAYSNIISFRAFNSGTLTLTPVIDMYVAVSYGGGTTPVMQRLTANQSASFPYNQETGVTEMETWIYSGDLIKDVGDLSVFYPNEIRFSKATKLRNLKIGSNASGYSNGNLRTIDVSNSVMLENLDVRNCPNLAIAVNVENSPRLKTAYFDGTSITGIDLAEGGALEKLHLPATITALTLINLRKLTELQVASYANVSRLMITNIDQTILNPITVLNAIPANSQVNIQGLYLEATGASQITSWFNLFDTMRGVTREKSSTGEWMYFDYDQAQISGEIHTDSLTGAQIAEFNARYPYIKVTADHTSSTLRFYNGSTLITSEKVLDGGDGTYTGTTPTKTQDAQYTYTFAGWSKDDDNTVDSDALTNVVADRNVYACFTGTLRKYTVYFVKASADGGGTLQTINNVNYGTTITAASSYTGATPTTSQGDATDYPFEGWEPASATVTGNTTFTAKFGSSVVVEEITDSWDTIIANIDNGTYATRYKIGNYKPLDLGTEGIINMQIVAMDADKLADGSGTVPLTFLSMELFNRANHNWGDVYYKFFGTYVENYYLPLIPNNIAARIPKIGKNYLWSDKKTYRTEAFKLFSPSASELGSTNNSYVETPGLNYAVFNNNASRVKTVNGENVIWVTRNKYSSTQDVVVSQDGSFKTTTPGGAWGYLLGFCLGLEPETTD